MSGQDQSFSQACYQFGGDWHVHCCTYDDNAPILTLSGRGAGLSVTTAGRGAGKEAVEFARALLREVQKFADEMERMHAAQLDDEDTKAVGSDAA